MNTIPLIVFGSLSLCIYLCLKTILDYRLKKDLLQRFGSSESTAIWETLNKNEKWVTLKWALILLLLGGTLCFLDVIPAEKPMLGYGIITMAIAAALFIYYFLLSGKRS